MVLGKNVYSAFGNPPNIVITPPKLNNIPNTWWSECVAVMKPKKTKMKPVNNIINLAITSP